MQKTIIKIQGMSCNHCTNFIKTTIEELDGIEACTVSLEDNAADVTFDSDKISEEQIKNAVRETHFELVE